MSDLIIKISADAKNVADAFRNIQKQSEDLESGLESAAKISGLAFAALSAQVGVSLLAFKEHEDASRTLSNALQNQGIFSEKLVDQYNDYAEAVSRATGLDKAQITQAQASLQTFIGQIPITKELTLAIADLAKWQGLSLPQAAQAMGKAIANGNGELLRLGLSFGASDTQAERLAETLDFVKLRAAGFAEGANQGLGSIQGLTTAFKESEAELGSRFAPAAEAAIKALTNFIQPAKDSNGIMVDFKASLIAVGFALTGMLTVVPLAVKGFITLRAAALALTGQLTALQIATGVGIIIALAVAVTELALHYKQVSAVVVVLIDNLKALEQAGLGVLKLFATLNPLMLATGQSAKIFNSGIKDIKEGFDKLAPAAKNAWNGVNEAHKSSLKEQAKAKREAALEDARGRAVDEKESKELNDAKKAYAVLQARDASKELLDIKKKEIETLAQIQAAEYEEDEAPFRAHLAKLREIEKEELAKEAEQKKTFDQQSADAETALARRNIQVKAKLTEEEKNTIRGTAETDQQAQNKVYTDELKSQIKAHNTFLEEKKKYGIAYATINRALHSEEVQGVNNATQNLVALQQSKNSTLKAIGKEAATAQIVIKTAEAAMNVYEGFSTIPFIGQALGIAAAAAVIAYGAEQVSNVQGAAAGGAVAGVGSGDSVPFMLEPGELIAPKQNFNEVVDSVATSRGYTPPGGDSGGAGYAEIQLSLKNDLMDFIEAKLIQRKFLNISLQGSR